MTCKCSRFWHSPPQKDIYNPVPYFWWTPPCGLMIAFTAICNVSQSHDPNLWYFCWKLVFSSSFWQKKKAPQWTMGSLNDSVHWTTACSLNNHNHLLNDHHKKGHKIGLVMLWHTLQLSWLTTVMEGVHYGHKLRTTCMLYVSNTLFLYYRLFILNTIH